MRCRIGNGPQTLKGFTDSLPPCLIPFNTNKFVFLKRILRISRGVGLSRTCGALVDVLGALVSKPFSLVRTLWQLSLTVPSQIALYTIMFIL